MKFSQLLIVNIVLVTLFASACSDAVNITANNSTANATSKVASSPQTATNNTAAPVEDKNSHAAANKTSEPDHERSEVRGELQMGKSESVILYVGMETGDYAAYCFANDSEVGRVILAACKDKEQCQVTGSVDHDSGCKVPGLEADLSASGRILKVDSAKPFGRRK